MSGHRRRFHYKAFDDRGRIIEGSVFARSQQDVADSLWRRGLTPLETGPHRQDDSLPWWRREIAGTSKPSAKAIAAFLREFATLLDAGLPIDASLRLLIRQAASGKLNDISGEILDAVLDGASLSEALRPQELLFGRDCLAMVRAGEQSGQLAATLFRIASLHERRLLIRERIRSALIYPTILLCMSALSVGVIIGVLIPAISPVFRENGQPLPILIAILAFARDNAGTIGGIFFLIVVLLVIAALMLSRNHKVRLAVSRVQLFVPMFGPALRDHNAERYARTLASLLLAGVPLLQGLVTAIDGVPNLAIRKELGQALDAVRNGATLSQATRKHVSFTAATIEMISIGEASATLGQALQRLADSNAAMLDRKIERALGFLTPALTVLIAAIIGGVVFSTMSAVLSINDLALQ